jgi:hypothetical protein
LPDSPIVNPNVLIFTVRPGKIAEASSAFVSPTGGG